VRPSIRLPLWAPLVLVGGAYILRSVVIRPGDFSIDATDALVLALVAVGILMVAIARRQASHGGDGEPDEERHGEDDSSTDRGQHE
jgi:hypothetical protein